MNQLRLFVLRRVAFSTAFALLALTHKAQADTCGQLAGVRGANVEILRAQHDRKGSEPVRYAMKISEKSVTPLDCDDVILAGKDSSARVVLSDSKLSLGADSRIEIAAHSKSPDGDSHVSLLNLTYGKLRALVNRKAAANGDSVILDVKKSKGSGESKGKVTFEIKTFSAVAGVRGTDFFVSYDPNAGLTDQATIDGSVEVTQAGTEAKVLVDAGKQVAVETTPQAVVQLQERLKAGQKPGGSELPKKLPAQGEAVKPLKVVAMNETTRESLRQTSAAVAEDRDFTSKKAVETLGQPSTWTLKREPIPDALKKLRNEY